MPLLFDMPMERLKEYRGTNPCPVDFDAYWERALEEMDAVDPQVEIVPDPDFQTPFATCSHLWFTGVGGARIHAKLLHPKNVSTPHPAVLMFHGYTGNSFDWMAEKPAYLAAGYTVAALDARGQGGLSEDVGGVKGTTMAGQIIRGLDDAPEKLLYRQIFLDTAQLAKIVMDLPEVDETRVGVTGRSQGGGLSLVCAALEPRIKRIAVAFPFLCDYRRVWDLDLAKDAYVELKEFFRWHDPQHKREEEVFTKLGYIDVQHFAPRIQVEEVVMAVGLMDKTCPPSTQFSVYNKIESKKSLEIYPDLGHDPFMPGIYDRFFQVMMAL